MKKPDKAKRLREAIYGELDKLPTDILYRKATIGHLMQRLVDAGADPETAWSIIPHVWNTTPGFWKLASKIWWNPHGAIELNEERLAHEKRMDELYKRP